VGVAWRNNTQNTLQTKPKTFKRKSSTTQHSSSLEIDAEMDNPAASSSDFLH